MAKQEKIKAFVRHGKVVALGAAIALPAKSQVVKSS